MQGPANWGASLTIPYGATTGARIVINGTTATITAYNSSNQVVYILSPAGLFLYVYVASAGPANITKDASTPVPVVLTGSTSTTITTASFSPPAASTVVIVVNVGLETFSATGPTVTVKDSLSNAYTAGPATYDSETDYTGIFTHYYATAPGSITVTATRTVETGQAMLQLVPYVLDGTASSQTGAGSNTAVAGASMTNTCEASLTTTQSGSWAIVSGCMDSSSVTLTPVVVTTDSTESDATDTETGVAGHAITSTPGATTMGWRVSANVYWSWAALEILGVPGAGPLVPKLSLSVVAGAVNDPLTDVICPEGITAYIANTPASNVNLNAGSIQFNASGAVVQAYIEVPLAGTLVINSGTKSSTDQGAQVELSSAVYTGGDPQVQVSANIDTAQLLVNGTVMTVP